MRYIARSAMGLALLAMAIAGTAAAQPIPQAMAQLDAAVAAVKAAIAAQPAPAAPAAAMPGDIPYVSTTWVVTARVGIGRVTYLGALPGGCPCTFNQPERGGTLTGSPPNITYRSSTPGQDTFTVRTADGRVHAYFVSVLR